MQVITRIRALFRQHDGCVWHTRGSRCELEQISNELRGTTSFVGRTVAQGHTARFWCSCKAASRASAVFSADDVSADAVVMRRWRAASRDCDANAVSAKPDPVTLEPCYIQHHYDLYNVEHARKPIRAARASVPLDRELAGAFVGKAGMRITALQTSLNGLRSVGVRPGCMRGGTKPTGGFSGFGQAGCVARRMSGVRRPPQRHYNERVVLSVRDAGPLVGAAEVAFVCPETRLSAVHASIVQAIHATKALRDLGVQRASARSSRRVRRSARPRAMSDDDCELATFDDIGSSGQAAAQAPAAVAAEQPLGGMQQLTPAYLASLPQAQQKNVLGEQLYKLISASNPSQAGKITGMLLELDTSEVLHLIGNPAVLTDRVSEAIEALNAAKNAATCAAQLAASPGRMSSADDAEVERAIELSLSEPCSAQEEDEYLNRAIQESLSPSFAATSEPAYSESSC